MTNEQVANLVLEDLARDLMLMDRVFDNDETVSQHIQRLYKAFEAKKAGRSPVVELFIKIAHYTQEQFDIDLTFDEIVEGVTLEEEE